MTDPRKPSVTTNGQMSESTISGTVSCPTCGLQLSTTTKFCPNDSTPLNNHEQERAIPNYQILRLIGSGGMGDVYEAEHVVLKQRAAIKTLKAHLIETSAFMRFQSEALAAGQLKHPNIVSVFDCGLSANGEPYMIMEMVSGVNLSSTIGSSGTLGLDESLDIISQICKAIDFAHEKGILHRDLKPSNIMIDVDGSTVTARILDFGIAKIVGEDPKLNLTRTGELLGTPSYMSPEQAQGLVVDRQSDVYSIGCILFELLTGQPPFLGRTAMEVMMKHISEAPLSLSQAGLKPFPGAIESLVARALEKNPAARFPTARDMDAAIRNYRKGLAAPVRDEKKPEQKPRILSKVMLLSLLSVGSLCAIVICLISWSLQPERTSKIIEPEVKQAEGKSSVSTSADPTGGTAVSTLADRSISKTADTAAEQHASEVENDEFASVLLRSQNELKITVPFECSDITDFGLTNLQYCHKLTELQIHECPHIKGDGLTALKKCPDLLYLDLRDCRGLSLLGLNSIVGLPLIGLTLNGTCLGDGSVGLVNKMHLQNLDMSHTNISNKWLLSLDPGSELKALYLKDTQVDHTGVKVLAKLKNLKTLSLDSCRRLDDQVIESLSNSKLESLSLNDCAITGESGRSFSQMRNLQTLYVRGTGINNAGLKALADVKTLKTLSLNGCQKFTDEGVSALSNSNLISLSLNDCAVKNSLVPALLHMQSLEKLSLQRTQIDQTGLERLASKKGLKQLDVSGCKLLHLEGVNAIRAQAHCKISFS